VSKKEKALVEQYLKLPYHVEIVRDEDEENPGYVARVVELAGCITQGDTFEELGEMIEDAMRSWIEVALKEGTPIPKPLPDEAYSGKFMTRVPRSLHRQIAQAAEREGVSLNQFVNVALANAVGQRAAPVTYPARDKKANLSVAEKRVPVKGKYAARKQPATK
jgi:antitoxin HicB